MRKKYKKEKRRLIPNLYSRDPVLRYLGDNPVVKAIPNIEQITIHEPTQRGPIIVVAELGDKS